MLADAIAYATPLAARATPPANGAEWVAAALVELLPEQGAGAHLTELRPILARYAVADTATASRPASPGMQNKETRTVPPAARGRLSGEEELATGLAGVWRVTLDDLREQMVPANFSRWLARTRLVSRSAGEAVVGVPDQVSAEQLARRFDPLVRRALADACGEPVTVRYEVQA